jgi:hypothetical protein
LHEHESGKSAEQQEGRAHAAQIDFWRYHDQRGANERGGR